jgi:hypothetical protein
VLHLALGIPAILAVLASTGHRAEAVYLGFLDEFARTAGGTPLYVTLVGSLCFFSYAWWRRVDLAGRAVSVALLSLVCVGPATRDLDGLVSPQPLPLLCLGLLGIALGCLKRSSWRCLMGCVCIVAAGSTAHVGGVPRLYQATAAYHVILLSVLVLGAVFDDAFGRWLRIAGSVLAVLSCVTIMLRDGGSFPLWIRWAYPLAMCVVLTAYGRLVGHQAPAVAAGAIVALWIAEAGWKGYQWLERIMAGFNYIALGMLCFMLAWLTSLAKAGRIPRATRSKGAMGSKLEIAKTSGA